MLEILIICLILIAIPAIAYLMWKLFTLIHENNTKNIEIAILQNEVKQKSEKIFEKEREISQKEHEILLKDHEILEKSNFLQSLEKKFSDTFQALSTSALSQNNQLFLDLAKSTFENFKQTTENNLANSGRNISNTINPIKDLLSSFDLKIQDLEKNRIGAYESIKQQITDLIDSQNHLKKETHNLASALKNPVTRGRWGEVQLKRVVELAGMVEHCDFKEQVYLLNDNNQENSNCTSFLRPDMIIYLPNEKNIVIDAKAPMDKYLQAINENDFFRKNQLLDEYSKDVKDTIIRLAGKKYWANLNSPEFVILFLPGDIFFSTALERDNNLIDYAMENKVLIASPTILITLLNVIAMNWKHENSYKNIKEILELNTELYNRICNMTDYFAKVGKSLDASVSAYNSTAASLEKRVLVSARKLKSIVNSSKEIDQLKEIQK